MLPPNHESDSQSFYGRFLVAHSVWNFGFRRKCLYFRGIDQIVNLSDSALTGGIDHFSRKDLINKSAHTEKDFVNYCFFVISFSIDSWLFVHFLIAFQQFMALSIFFVLSICSQLLENLSRFLGRTCSCQDTIDVE